MTPCPCLLHCLFVLLLVPPMSATSSCHTNADCSFPHGVCTNEGVCACYIPFIGNTCNRTAPQCLPDKQQSCDHCNGFVYSSVGCFGEGSEWNCTLGYGLNIPNFTKVCNADGVCPLPPQRSCISATNATGTPVCSLPYNWTHSPECCGRWGCGCPQTTACDGPLCYEHSKICPSQGCPQNGGEPLHDIAECSMM